MHKRRAKGRGQRAEGGRKCKMQNTGCRIPEGIEIWSRSEGGTGNGAGYKIPVARHLIAVRGIVIFPKPAGPNPIPETEPGTKSPVARLPFIPDRILTGTFLRISLHRTALRCRATGSARLPVPPTGFGPEPYYNRGAAAPKFCILHSASCIHSRVPAHPPPQAA